MLCGDRSCGCAFVSSTLNISVDDQGVVTLEQAEFTEITAMQAAIDTLETQMTAALADITDLQADVVAAQADADRLDILQSSTLTASAVGPTSGATALTLLSQAFSAFGVAGRILFGGHAAYTKTVTTDVFDVFATYDGTQISRAIDRTQLSSGWASAIGSASVAASDTPTISIQLARSSGTGTATTVASTNACRLWWIFIPS